MRLIFYPVAMIGHVGLLGTKNCITSVLVKKPVAAMRVAYILGLKQILLIWRKLYNFVNEHSNIHFKRNL